MKTIPAALLALLLNTHGLLAGEWWDSWKGDLRATWGSDRHSVILPVNTYHVRATYDKERIENYNEIPWGLGVERFYVDARENRHSFYALAFAASYGHVQPVVGYSWEKSFFFDSAHATRLGVGYAAIITARQQNAYIPFPGALPVLSFGYKSLSVQTSWVPYVERNYGNIFLTVVKFDL